ncbi:MAG TPA: GAF domain-containing protein, partial [Anaerolineae bacterium]|nr:GAF domain-containing protein [Anaerolineae bacterium]
MSSTDSIATIPINPELGEVLDSILRDLGQVVQYDRVHILLLASALHPLTTSNPIATSETDVLIAVRDRSTLRPDQAERDYIPADLYPLNRRLLEELQPIVIGDTLHNPAWIKEGVASGLRAWIGVPLVVKDKAIGVLTVHSRTAGVYTARDGNMVFAFANQAAEAIDKVQLLEQARSRLRAMQALRNINLRMIASLNIDQVLDTICENVLQLIDAEDTHIFLYDEKLDEFTKSVALWRSGERRPAVSKPRRGGLTYRVRAAGEPIVIHDAPSHELYSTPEAQKWGIQSIA